MAEVLLVLEVHREVVVSPPHVPSAWDRAVVLRKYGVAWLGHQLELLLREHAVLLHHVNGGSEILRVDVGAVVVHAASQVPIRGIVHVGVHAPPGTVGHLPCLRVGARDFNALGRADLRVRIDELTGSDVAVLFADRLKEAVAPDLVAPHVVVGDARVRREPVLVVAVGVPLTGLGAKRGELGDADAIDAHVRRHGIAVVAVDVLAAIELLAAEGRRRIGAGLAVRLLEQVRSGANLTNPTIAGGPATILEGRAILLAIGVRTAGTRFAHGHPRVVQREGLLRG